MKCLRINYKPKFIYIYFSGNLLKLFDFDFSSFEIYIYNDTKIPDCIVLSCNKPKFVDFTIKRKLGILKSFGDGGMLKVLTALQILNYDIFLQKKQIVKTEYNFDDKLIKLYF